MAYQSLKTNLKDFIIDSVMHSDNFSNSIALHIPINTIVKHIILTSMYRDLELLARKYSIRFNNQIKALFMSSELTINVRLNKSVCYASIGCNITNNYMVLHNAGYSYHRNQYSPASSCMSALELVIPSFISLLYSHLLTIFSIVKVYCTIADSQSIIIDNITIPRRYVNHPIFLYIDKSLEFIDITIRFSNYYTLLITPQSITDMHSLSCIKNYIGMSVLTDEGLLYLMQRKPLYTKLIYHFIYTHSIKLHSNKLYIAGRYNKAVFKGSVIDHYTYTITPYDLDHATIQDIETNGLDTCDILDADVYSQQTLHKVTSKALINSILTKLSL